MRKNILLSLTFSLILMNIYVVSAQTESMSEINMGHATKTEGTDTELKPSKQQRVMLK